MPRNPDPKHGRWILPLILVAMVVLTITFVTNLKPAQTEAGTTTTSSTTTAPTTTTLPMDVAAFMVTLDLYETRVNAFLGDIQGINADWEGRQSTGVTQDETRAAFEQVRTDILAWENEVAGAADVPQDLAAGHVDLVVEVEKLAPAVEDIILGLDAPDDGTLRRTAMIDFEDQVAAVLDAIESLREAALGTGTPDGGSSTTTTTSGGEEPTTSITTSTTSTTVPGTNA